MMKYHPDKRSHDPDAVIKYQILSNMKDTIDGKSSGGGSRRVQGGSPTLPYDESFIKRKLRELRYKAAKVYTPPTEFRYT
jgi:hypothetical protein